MTEAESALQFIDAHERKIWVEIGMAIKSENGEDAFSLFDNWSRTADNYCPVAAKAVWRSFKPAGGITINTLFHHARKAGWKPDGRYTPPTPEERAERARIAAKRFNEAEVQLRQAQARAARYAAKIMSECELNKHAYLDKKGLGDVLWNTWRAKSGEVLLVVPLIFEKRICSIQFISDDGSKNFLKNSRTSEATFELSNGGQQIWLCEGLATGLALQKILEACRLKYTIKVCFSAQNMLKVSNHDDFMCADHDASGTGLKVADQSGCKFYMPKNEGWDVCDELQNYRLLGMTMKIREWLKNG